MILHLIVDIAYIYIVLILHHYCVDISIISVLDIASVLHLIVDIASYCVDISSFC